MYYKGKPISTGGAAVVPYSEDVCDAFKSEDRFTKEEFCLYQIVESNGVKRLWLPRNLAPLGKQDLRKEGVPVKFTSSVKPRNEEQARVIEESITLLKQGANFITESPTGSGKTVMAMEVIAKIGKKTLIIVPKEDIKDQWVEAAINFLGLTKKEIGIIQGDVCQVEGKKIVIAMVQTMAKIGKFSATVWSDFGMLVVDESHKIGADYFSNSGYLVPAKLRWGLSATPKRKDGRDIVLKAHIGEILVRSESIPMAPKVLVVKSKFKLPVVTRKINGEFRRVKLPHKPGRTMNINKLLANDEQRNKLIVNFVKQAYEKDRCIMVCADTKEHLERLYDLLIPTKVIHHEDLAFYVGGLKKKEREKAVESPVLLCTYKYIDIGTDLPWFDTLVFATPRSDIVQTAGRILREYPDKKQPILFDLVDEDSEVFSGYYFNRRRYYKKIGASVKERT